MISRRASLPFRILMAVACGALIAAPRVARADRNPVSETKSLHEWAALVPTASGTGVAVPGEITSSSAVGHLPPIFFPFTTGNVDLNALMASGSTTGKISVSGAGYAPGTYVVDAVLESSSSAVPLGTLLVTSGSFPIWTGSNPIVYGGPVHAMSTAALHSDYVISPVGLSTGFAVFGGTAAPFPGGFSPFDVASVNLRGPIISLAPTPPGYVSSFAIAAPLLVANATLTPVPAGYYSALSPLVAGTSAPGATGYALIRANTPLVFEPMVTALASANIIIHGPIPVMPPIVIDPLPPILNGATTGRLVIHAHGLPASTTLTYAADGTDLGTATTTAAGNLTVFAQQGKHRKLPATLDLFSVKTVTVHDASGNVLVSASF